MKFISMNGYDLKQGAVAEAQEWLAANEEKVAAAAPDGCSYMGTFFSVQTSEKNAGSSFTLWGLDSYGAQDAWAAAAKSGPLADLFAQWLQFIDMDNSANWSSILLKSAVDATVFDAE